MGVYAAMAGIGATVELLPGGVLTDALDWRWVFFIDIPIGLAVLAGTKSLVEAERPPGRLDVPGAITGTGGLIALVHGITRGGGPPSAGSGREAAPAGYRGCEGRGRPRNSPGPSGIVRRAARTPRTGRFPQRHDTSGPLLEGVRPLRRRGCAVPRRHGLDHGSLPPDQHGRVIRRRADWLFLVI